MGVQVGTAASECRHSICPGGRFVQLCLNLSLLGGKTVLWLMLMYESNCTLTQFAAFIAR